MTVSRTRAAALCVLLASTSLATPAFAQNEETALPRPPRAATIDENGVDLIAGQIVLPSDTLSIGSLSYERIRRDYAYDDNYTTALVGDGTGKVVTIGASVDRFGPVSAVPTVSLDGTGATLRTHPTIAGGYLYVTDDGVQYSFDPAYRSDRVRVAEARVGEIAYPDGRKITIEYLIEQRQNCKPNTGQCFGDPFPISRPSAVQANDGYRLSFGYQAGTPPVGSNPPIAPWMTLTSVTATNAIEPASSSGWRSVSFTTNGATESWTDARNKTMTITRNAEGRVIGIRPPGASQDAMTVQYTAGGLVSFINRGGRQWGYGFTDTAPGERSVLVTMPSGLQRQMTVNTTFAQVLTDKVGTGGTTTYTPDPSTGLLKTVTWPEGNKADYGYDVRGNVVSTTLTPKGGGATIATTAGYPADCSASRINCNKPLWTRDARGNQTDYTYDPTHGGVLTVTLPRRDPSNQNEARGQVRYSYERIAATYRNSGGTLTAASPGIWKLTGVSQCASGATTANPAACVGGAAETRTVIAYAGSESGTAGANNLLPTSVTVRSGDNSVSATSAYRYDRYGDATSVDGPLAGTGDTSFARYDADHALIGTISAVSGTGQPRRAVRVARDDAGRTTSVEQGTVTGGTDTDWANFQQKRVLTSSYDPATRLKVRDVVTVGGTTYGLTEYKFDDDRRARCTAVRVGTATGGDACIAQSGGYGYDLVAQTDYGTDGRVSAQWENGVQSARFTYSLNGKVTNLKDANGNDTGYSYDAYDRPKRTTHAGGAYEEAQGIDEDGHVTSYRKRDGTIVGSTYDGRGQLAGMTLPSSATNASPGYAYDLMGRLVSASQGNGQAAWISGMGWTIDALGRVVRQVATIGNATSRVTTFVYDTAGRRTRIKWGEAGSNAFLVDYDWQPSGDLYRVRENGAGSGVGVLATFGYNELGERTSLTRGNGRVTTWTPDVAGRLQSIAHGFANGAGDVTLSFTRDGAGRIGDRTTSNDAYAWRGWTAGNRSYAANALNQYTVADNGAMGYDDNGNTLTLPNNLGLTYNALDQLVSANNGTSLAYDPLGRLAYLSGGNGTVRFDYEGQDLLSEIDAGGNVLRRYVHADGIDEPLVWYEGAGAGDRRWLHGDERGSVIATSNTSGTQTSTNRYDSYGVPASGNVGRFQYTGQTWLPELGMYYYKARMYAPGIGRFVQTDPIGVAGGVNLYRYVGNDPINSSDPSGLRCEFNGTVYGYDQAGCSQVGGTYIPDPDIVVTGSRMGSSNFSFPFPVSSTACAEGHWLLGGRCQTATEYGFWAASQSVTPPTGAAPEQVVPRACQSLGNKIGNALESAGKGVSYSGLAIAGIGAFAGPEGAVPGLYITEAGGVLSTLGQVSQDVAFSRPLREIAARAAINAFGTRALNNIVPRSVRNGIGDAIFGQVVGEFASATNKSLDPNRCSK